MSPISQPPMFAVVTYTSDGYVRSIQQVEDAGEAAVAYTRLATHPHPPPFEVLQLSQEDYGELYTQSQSAGRRFYGARADVSPLRGGPLPPQPQEPRKT